MRKILLASAGVMVMSAGMAYAACIPTPSCASLGYESSSSCEGGIKCPFGNAWNCTLVNKITEIENKITEIINNAGNPSCQVGYIYYSDKTCSMSLDGSKTPIGVVVYVDGRGHGQVMALEKEGSGYLGGNFDEDISTLENFYEEEDAARDFDSCSNTEKILAAGGEALGASGAYYASQYTTEGTSAGDWCLPAAGVLASVGDNFSVVNNAFILAGGDKLSKEDVLSSTEASAYSKWMLSVGSSSAGLVSETKRAPDQVRPVLEF